MRAEEFRLAGVCGLHILKHPDHVEELIQHYERAGHPTELIQLMEQVIRSCNFNIPIVNPTSSCTVCSGRVSHPPPTSVPYVPKVALHSPLVMR